MLQSVPSPEAGVITMWAGLVSGVPTGWALCDGTNGTPDLRDKFIPCFGQLFHVGHEGGSVSHTHSWQLEYHDHEVGSGVSLDSEPSIDSVTSQAFGELTVESANHTPPAYRLAYIMKLP